MLKKTKITERLSKAKENKKNGIKMFGMLAPYVINIEKKSGGVIIHLSENANVADVSQNSITIERKVISVAESDNVQEEFTYEETTEEQSVGEKQRIIDNSDNSPEAEEVRRRQAIIRREREQNLKRLRVQKEQNASWKIYAEQEDVLGEKSYEDELTL